jgi:ribosome recycling factor
MITTFITIGGTAVGVIGWFVRHERMERRRKVLFKKLMDEVDAVYSRFKMNAVQCEAELYNLKDEVLDEFKEGTINEDKHRVLEQRIEKYMKEVKEQIDEDKSR